jgi:hypothetical protein
LFRNGLETNTLRFVARIQTKDPIQADRRFIISYFLSDDSIMINEPPIKNSGINGGRFLERTKVKKPTNPPFSTKLPDYYTYRDFYVGAVLSINSFLFKLYDADEYCYKFMEKKVEMFPFSNLQGALAKFSRCADLASLDACLKRIDSFATGCVDFNSFFSNVRNLTGIYLEANFLEHKNQFIGLIINKPKKNLNYKGDQLNEQEIITLARGYSLERKKEYDFQSIAAVTQEHLRKNNFELFARLREVLQSCDSFNVDEESVSVDDARSIARGFKLPVPEYLLDMLLQ